MSDVINTGWHSSVPEPTPQEIRALRGARTIEEMAKIAGLSHGPRWSEYERAQRRPHWALWEMLLLKLDVHPTKRLYRRRT